MFLVPESQFQFLPQISPTYFQRFKIDKFSYTVFSCMSICLHSCLSDSIPVLDIWMPFCPRVCPHACLSICQSPLFSCLGVEQRQALCIPPRTSGSLAVRWKANDNWAFRLLPRLSNRVMFADTLWLLFNASLTKALLRGMPSKHAIMEKQILRPVHVCKHSHRLKKWWYIIFSSTFYIY